MTNTTKPRMTAATKIASAARIICVDERCYRRKREHTHHQEGSRKSSEL
jgi:hypothetical protein